MAALGTNIIGLLVSHNTKRIYLIGAVVDGFSAMTTAIASHRPLPYTEINVEWQAMLARIASVCPIYHSNIGLGSAEQAEVVIEAQHKRHVKSIENILFLNRRLDPLERHTTEHLITFRCQQRLRSRRELGTWRAVKADEAPQQGSVVNYVYEGKLG